jgi:DNA helicase-2/ATP-dependent DNA helicase PcrA
MHAVGEHAECPIVPAHQTVSNPAEGIFDHFLPAVRELDIPLGRVAIMASWWVSLFNLARELRRQNIPAIGPGARPYKRSHLIAQLVEPIGAYLESPESEIAIAVQRSLFVLIATLTDHAPYSVFDFKGRVVVCKLLAEAAAARDTSVYAIKWIADAAERFSFRLRYRSEILFGCSYLGKRGVPVLRQATRRRVAKALAEARP